MRRSTSTVILAGALAAACSKPNPLFLDTWGGLSDSDGTLSDSGASTTGEPTTTPTTSTTDPPPTTTTTEPVTSTTTDALTTSGPTATSTTEPGCTMKELAPIAPADDTFLVRAADAGQSCNLVNDEVFPDDSCKYLDFGTRGLLSLFRAFDVIDPQHERIGAYALRFDRDEDGLLKETLQGPSVPLTEIQELHLRLVLSRPVNAPELEAVILDVYAFPPDLAWYEGPGDGKPCFDGPASFACRQCNEGPQCVQAWSGAELDMAQLNYVGYVELPGPAIAGTEYFIEVDPKWFGVEPNEGFLFLMAGAVQGGQPFVDVPPGVVRMHAKEYAPDDKLRPYLKVKVCSP